MVHINNPDNIVIMDWLVKSMKSVSGTITINAEKEPAIQINARTNRIDIDMNIRSKGGLELRFSKANKL